MWKYGKVKLESCPSPPIFCTKFIYCFTEMELFRIFCLLWRNLGKLDIAIAGSLLLKALECANNGGNHFKSRVQVTTHQRELFSDIVPFEANDFL